MSEDERAIRELVETWMEATRAGDHAAVLALMTRDVIYMVPGRAPFGREAFEVPAGVTPPNVEGRADVLEVAVLGDWAYSRNYLEMTFTPPGGAPTRLAGHTLSLYRKEADGRWRLARDANMVTPQA